MSDLKEYIKQSRQIGLTPKDQYSLSWNMITRDESEVISMSRLMQHHILLANIKDDVLIRLYQNDGILLTSFYDMGTRAIFMQPLFSFLYYGWIMELGITRTKEGKERDYQAAAGSGFQPREDLGSYGMMEQPRYDDHQQQQQQQQQQPLIKR